MAEPVKTNLELQEELEPLIAAAFIAAIRAIVSRVRIVDIVDALKRNDITKAIELLYIERPAFDVFEKQIEAAYGAGGVAEIERAGTLRDSEGRRAVIRFNGRNYRAEQWLKQHSSQEITRIIDDQRLAIRNAIERGMQAGDNPNKTALDLIGRIDPVTKKRTGGIVGLSEPQEAAVDRAKQELREGKYSEYLQRAARDKRFDKAIAVAKRDGKPLTEAQIEKAIGRYSDKLLQLRGFTISRTEALASLHAAQYEALLQMVESGTVNADQVKRVWDDSGDSHVRFDHAVADGQEVGLYEAFTVGGARMMYPGDPAGGAKQTVMCRCHCRTKIDYLKRFRGLGLGA
jgi:hypothetical protein